MRAALLLTLLSSTAFADRALKDAPKKLASTVALAPASEPGERLRLTLVVGPGAVVYAYHTDVKGSYGPGGPLDPRLFGYARADAAGRVVLDTIRPGPYPDGGTPAHVHVVVAVPGRGEVVDECWFEGDPYLDEALRAREQARGERSRILRLERDGKGWRGRWTLDVARR